MNSKGIIGQSAMTVANPEKAAQRLEAYLNAGMAVMMSGAPGIGKSDIVRQLASKRGWEASQWKAWQRSRAGKMPAYGLVDVRLSQFDPVDLRGLPDVDRENGLTHWLPPAIMPFAGQEARFSERGIIFLDEITQAAPSVQASAFQLVLDRAIGEHALMPGWDIVAAGNRSEDKAGVQKMLTPLANRMAHIDVEPDVEAWAKWAVRNEVDPFAIAFIRFRPEMLHRMPERGERSFPTPRSIASAAKFTRADASMRMGLIAGLVGDGWAAEFEGFLRAREALPSIAEILANPDSAKVPGVKEPSLQYAVATAIAHRADAGNFAAVLTYAQRLPREFEIIVATDAVRRLPALAETAPYVAWAVRNQDVTL